MNESDVNYHILAGDGKKLSLHVLSSNQSYYIELIVQRDLKHIVGCKYFSSILLHEITSSYPISLAFSP